MVLTPVDASPGSGPDTGMNWCRQLDRHAHRDPEGVAFRFEGESTTWRGLQERVRALAVGFGARGVSHGDRVALLLQNRPEFMETVLAANLLGAVAVPVNRLTADELAYVLTDSGSALLVTETALVGVAVAAAPARLLVTGTGELPAGAESFDALASSGEPRPAELPSVRIDERDPALIMYTSGTTGRPKGAVLTHLNLASQAFRPSLSLFPVG